MVTGVLLSIVLLLNSRFALPSQLIQIPTLSPPHLITPIISRHYPVHLEFCKLMLQRVECCVKEFNSNVHIANSLYLLISYLQK